MEQIKKITESTMLPISLVIVLAGGIFWFSTVYARVDSIVTKQNDYMLYMRKVDERLSRIEGKLGIYVPANQ